MNVVMKTNEVQVHANGSTAKEKTIAFTFNPDEVEMVRAKDGAYIIRERRTRSVENSGQPFHTGKQINIPNKETFNPPKIK